MDTTSVWRATAPPWAFPTLTEDTDADVVVVGGGITGITTGLLCARAGLRVVVLERRTIGAGSTGNTTAKVSALHGTTYQQLVARIGDGGARAYAAANVAGVALVRELATALAPEAEAVNAPSFTFAWDEANLGTIHAEVTAAEQAGLPVRFTTETDLPFEVAGAVRLDDQLRFHPQRYLVALALDLERLGGRVYEHTAATGVHETDKGDTPGARPSGQRVEVATADGRVVRAGHAVIATLLPFLDIGGFFAKAEPSRSYALSAEIEGPAPAGMYLSADSPTRSVRPLSSSSPGGSAIVAEGPSHKTGTETDTGRFYTELEDWVRERFAVRDITHRWSAQDYSTPDHVPYVGRCPRTTNVLVATGFHKWGLSNGTAAAIMMTDLITGADNPWLATFDATRIAKLGDAPQLVKQNLDVAKHVVVDLLKRVRPPNVDHLGSGEGGIVEVDGHSVGAYRDHDGRVVAVSLTCTHLGCTVQWNGAERSWDCPCHASRFDRFGAVLEGPATSPLTIVDVGLPEVR